LVATMSIPGLIGARAVEPFYESATAGFERLCANPPTAQADSRSKSARLASAQTWVLL